MKAAVHSAVANVRRVYCGKGCASFSLHRVQCAADSAVAKKGQIFLCGHAAAQQRSAKEGAPTRACLTLQLVLVRASCCTSAGCCGEVLSRVLWKPAATVMLKVL